MNLRISRCYALAWRSFRTWWIPICLLSGGLFIFEVVPRFLLHDDLNGLRAQAMSVIDALRANNPEQIQIWADQMRGYTVDFTLRVLRLTALSFPFVALLTILLLMVANWAVKDHHDRRKPLLQLLWITLIHVVLAIAKLLAFFCCVIPGVYLYVKLLFVSLVMLERDVGPLEAIKKSWRMTDGNFWELLALVLINTLIQIASAVTIIGVIPATGFANTARTAAFQMLWHAHPRQPPPLVA